MPVTRAGFLETKTLITRLGYGIHYPVRHGQVENWVRLVRAYWDAATDSGRTTWNDSGPIRYSNTYALSQKITTFFLPNRYVFSPFLQLLLVEAVN